MCDPIRARLTRSCGKQLSMYTVSMMHTSRAAMSPAPPVKQLKFAYARNPPTAHFSRRRGPMASSCIGPHRDTPWGQPAGLVMPHAMSANILQASAGAGLTCYARMRSNMREWGLTAPSLSLGAPPQGAVRWSVYSVRRMAVAAAADRLSAPCLHVSGGHAALLQCGGAASPAWVLCKVD